MSELPIQQGGLRVLSGIVPASSASTYGTHYSYLGVGGYVEVPNIDYRNSIPPDSNMNDEGYSTGRRRYGMMVYVIDEDKLYRLFPFSGGSVVSMETFTGTSELNQVTMLSNNNGWIEVPDLSVLITGGTYFSGNSSIVLYDSTGGTVSITGITTTDVVNPGDGRVLVSTGNSENIFVAQSNMVFNGTNLNITGGTFITDSSGSLHSSAIIQFKSTTKGVLLPGMTTSQKNAIVNPTTGLTVYDSTIEDISVYTSSGWTGVIAERDNLQKVTERGNSTNSGLIISGTTYLVGSGSTTGNTFVTSNSANTQTFTIKDNGNILIGTTTDAGYKLDVNGTARVQGAVDVTGTITSTASGFALFKVGGNGVRMGNLTFGDGGLATTQGASSGSLTWSAANYSWTLNKFLTIAGSLTVNTSITAASALAQGVFFNNTLVAAANNDVLVGLDINPTFTNGAFTGLSNLAARIQGNLLIGTSLITGVTSNIQIKTIDSTLSMQTTSNTGYTGVNMYNEGNTLVGSFQIGNSSVGIPSLQNNFFFGARTSTGRTIIIRGSNATPSMTVFSTGNVLIQDGGTHTDAGYKLDVNGSTRIVGSGSTTGNTFVTSNSANTQTFTIKDNGNVLIGTTTDSGYKLDVVGADSMFNGVRVGLGAGGVSTNTVVGSGALNANTDGSSITAIGYQALKFTTGSNNTAVGFEAGFSNTSANSNVAIGWSALRGNTTGSSNVAIGSNAAKFGADGGIGDENVVVGIQAMQYGGSYNTALGSNASRFNEAGTLNVAVGGYSLYNNSSGSNIVSVGYQSLYNNTASNNTAVGYQAGTTNTSGTGLTAIGYQALRLSTGDNNTAVGFQALDANTTGIVNTALGANALGANTTGGANTAIGVSALQKNTTGIQNTAIGVSALLDNTTGSSNTANGISALQNNTTGNDNTANGVFSLYSNTTGSNNTANGLQSLFSNTTGASNTANGVNALQSNTTGSNNTANGASASQKNTTGNDNTANGKNALENNTTGSSNTSIGVNSLANVTTSSNNTAVGFEAGYAGVANTTGANNIFIGYQSTGVLATESNRTWIGNSSTTSTWLAGNVLVGTTTDAGYKLNVNGTVKISSTIYLGGNTDIIDPSSNSGFMTIGSNQPIRFTNASSTEFLRIATSGNVLIGTTTDFGYKLDVSGTTRVVSTGSTSGSTTLTLQNSTGRTTTEFRSDGVIGISSASTFTTQVTSVISASTTNSGIAIVTNGTGAFTLNIPDGTAVGGTARGTNAVDLQMSRTSASSVAAWNYDSILGGRSNYMSANADGYRVIGGGFNNQISVAGYSFIGGGSTNIISGGGSAYNSILGGLSNTASSSYSIVIGGSSNTASGQYSVAGGTNNIASGQGSITIGYGNNASGNYSLALGIYNSASAVGAVALGGSGSGGGAGTGGNTASGIGSFAVGQGSSSYLYGQNATAAYKFAANGDAQQSLLTSRAISAVTSGGTVTLSLDGTGITNLIIPNGNNRAWNVVVNTITVCTVVSGGTLTVGDAHAGEYKFLFKRVGGTSTISPITTSSEVADTSMATASFSFSAGTSQQMSIRFNAPNTANNSTFRAVAKVALTEVAW